MTPMMWTAFFYALPSILALLGSAWAAITARSTHAAVNSRLDMWKKTTEENNRLVLAEAVRVAALTAATTAAEVAATRIAALEAQLAKADDRLERASSAPAPAAVQRVEVVNTDAHAVPVTIPEGGK